MWGATSLNNFPADIVDTVRIYYPKTMLKLLRVIFEGTLLLECYDFPETHQNKTSVIILLILHTRQYS